MTWRGYPEEDPALLEAERERQRERDYRQEMERELEEQERTAMTDLKAQKERWLESTFPFYQTHIGEIKLRLVDKNAARLIRLYEAEREAERSCGGDIDSIERRDAATAALNAAWAEILGENRQ